MKTATRSAHQESQARIKKNQEEAKKAYDANICPICGRGVRRNSSLAGWIQCEQFGAEGFRKDSSMPSCDWQGFMEVK